MGQSSCKQAQLSPSDDAIALRLSVIIPALNESACIAAALASVRSAVVAPVDVLVVDGGSTDDTVRVAEQHGAKVIRAERGRGRQLNAGWRATRGDWCLFLHSDSQLPPRYDERIAAALRASQQHQQRSALWATHHAGSTATAAATETEYADSKPASGLTLAATATITGAAAAATANTTASLACRGGWLKRSTTTTSPTVAATPEATAAGAHGAGGGWHGCSPGAEEHRDISGMCGGRGGSPGCVGEVEGGVGVRWGGRTVAPGRGGWGSGRVPDSRQPQQQQLPTWGAFATISTDLRNPLLRTLLSTGVELRTRLLKRPYGDQAIFVRRDILEACGGFVEWPLLEDLELVQRLSRDQAPVIVDAPIATSGRRWQSVGFLRTTLINQAILAAYAAGVAPETLARWYRDAKRAVASS